MKVRYLGCSDEQARWGQCKDPRPHLTVNHIYNLVDTEVHSWHTLYFVEGFKDGFNSCCFEEVLVPKAPEDIEWLPWDGKYAKQVYLVKTQDGKIYECWPNAGFMSSIDGSGKQFSPTDKIKILTVPMRESDEI